MTIWMHVMSSYHNEYLLQVITIYKLKVKTNEINEFWWPQEGSTRKLLHATITLEQLTKRIAP